MKKRRGYTLIELVLVLMLLVLVAGVVFTLAASGSQTYLRLTEKQSQSTDLRTGLSYLDVQIRKHDTQGALSIRPGPFDSQPSLVISQEISGKTYLTYIYLRDGFLCELFVADDTVITEGMGSRIAAINSMQLDTLADGSLKITLSRQTGDQALISGSRTVYLRAGGIGS
jgi:prepilin-type N-terminal cleavage/methylation domain-containing protein